jgi:ssDNA-binding Zn-finger/Zn-ribbon topoisomerase 1
MHLYKKEKEQFRFRCSNYPACKTYIKMKKGDLKNELLPPPCARTIKAQNPLH